MPNEATEVKTNIATQCPYCGVGCGTLLQTDKGRVVGVKPDARHPTNRGLQCVKGLTAAKPLYVDRLTTPLIRKDLTDPLAARPSRTKGRFDADLFREASWDEAEKLVAEKVAAVVKQHGGGAVGLYGSGQLPVEAQWLQSLLMKGVIGSGAVEGNARMFNTAAAAAYLETMGLDGPQATYDDIEQADMVVHWGHNPRSAHPVLFWRIADRKATAKLPTLVVDPRRTGTVTALEQVSRASSFHLQTVGGDIALCNAIAHVIASEHREAVDREALARDAVGWQSYLEGCKARYAPEEVQAVTGVDPKAVRKVAAGWAAASVAGRKRGTGGVLCFWGSGLNQALHGHHNAVSLINLLALTGNVGREGCGPLTMAGQPNAAGERLTGGLTGLLPFHRRLDDAAWRDRIADAWRVPRARLAQVAAQKNPGFIIGMLERALKGEQKVMFLIGASHLDLPDTERLVRPALTRTFTVVNEIYRHAPNNLYADVVLPAACWGEWVGGTFIQSERRFNLCEGTANPLAGTRPDIDILIGLGRRIAAGLGLDAAKIYPYQRREDGLYDPEPIFREIVAASRGSLTDLTGMLEVERRDKTGLYEQIRSRRGVQWPMSSYAAARAGGSGRRLFGPSVSKPWPTTDGKLHLRLCEQQPVAVGEQREVLDQLRRAGVDQDFLVSEQLELLGRARDLALSPEQPDAAWRGKHFKEVPADKFPYWLGLGVVYEHYHSAKTIRAPTPRKLCNEQYVELHPADARALGVADGELVRVVTRRGSFEGRAAVGSGSRIKPSRNAVPRGYLFSPWALSVADAADPRDNRWLVNAAAHRAFDPVSGQPAFKHLVARIEKIEPPRAGEVAR